MERSWGYAEMGRGEWAGIRANGCVVWVGICGELWKAEPGMYVRASVCGGTWGSCVEGRGICRGQGECACVRR